MSIVYSEKNRIFREIRPLRAGFSDDFAFPTPISGSARCTPLQNNGAPMQARALLCRSVSMMVILFRKPAQTVIFRIMSDVTSILNAIESGDAHAAAQLLPLVYDELRKLAAQKMANEKPGQTLDATALVHEAYLRLVGDSAEQCWNTRGHFFAAAAEAMRRILVENARRKMRKKHGGGRQRLDVEEVDSPDRSVEDERILAVDEALQRLAEQEPKVAEVVRLRWFAGLSIEETAETLNISVRTANRHWAYARAWLYQRLKADGDDK